MVSMDAYSSDVFKRFVSAVSIMILFQFARI
jgi:hypothetical protein